MTMKKLKIGLHSDLHLELQQPPGDFLSGPVPDILILAGDIAYIDQVHPFLVELSENFTEMDIIYVCGNHEFYHRSHMDKEIATLKRNVKKQPRIHFLQCDVIELHGIRFLGCTAWSEMLYFGKDRVNDIANLVGNCVNDFHVIRYQDQIFTPRNATAIGKKHRKFLESKLSEKSDLPTVVVTHFSPTVEYGNARFRISELSAYFSNTYEDIIQKNQPDFWCFGHTHYNVDTFSGKTRIISNQKGYGRECEGDYDPNFIFEIEVNST